MPRDDMLRRMSSKEFTHWLAYWKVEGWETRADADRRHAEMMTLHANVHRDRKKRKEPYTIQDFMPQIEKPSLAEQTRRKVKAFMARQRAKGM